MLDNLLSVVVPVYYAETYIDICMKCLFEQTYTNLQILLVIDESSEDKSLEMCNLYEKKDERVEVIHVHGVKPGEARNAGMDAAKGKYLVFLDVDDTLPNNAYEILVGEMNKKNVDIVFGLREVLIEETNEKTIVSFKDEKTKSVPPYFCGIYKVDYLNRNSIRYTGFRMGEDICFHVQIAANMPSMAYINEVVYIVHRSMYANSRVVERKTGLYSFKNYSENINWRKWVCEFSHKSGKKCTEYVEENTFYNSELVLQLLNYTEKEREIGLVYFKELIALTEKDIDVSKFSSIFGISYSDFGKMQADEFFIMYLRYLSNAKLMIELQCENGNISLKYILGLLKRWLKRNIK